MGNNIYYLQSVKRVFETMHDNDIIKNCYEAMYSNGFSYISKEFHIKDGESIINIPSQIKDEFIYVETKDFITFESSKDDVHNMAACMLSVFDSLKLHDMGMLVLDGETLSELMIRKVKAYGIDLQKELGLKNLEPVKRKDS